jgi:acid phosphatase type 7
LRGREQIVLVIAVVLAIGIGVGVAAAVRDGNQPEAVEATGDGRSATVLAAGDIAECDHQGDEATAKILAGYPDATILPLGDLAYDHGTPEEFTRCFATSWGKFKSQMRPATGNHDHSTKNAQGYWDYFADQGGPYDKYYYSYTLGSWHLVALNSDCWRVGGCASDEPQAEWLRSDLAKSGALCTLAYWHRPPFTSGRYGDPSDTARVRPLWRILHENGVEILLNGHEHSYERFALMDADGKPDEAGGVREIIVGTGGGNLRPYENPPLPTTEVRDSSTWGVLRLSLDPGKYAWRFIPVAGGTFTDSGSGTCH